MRCRCPSRGCRAYGTSELRIVDFGLGIEKRSPAGRANPQSQIRNSQLFLGDRMTASSIPSGIPGANFLDPRVLARIDNLALLARIVVEGFLNGLHHSPYLGLSVDFAEHRAYMPGDDIRRIDWRLWARTDRFYVKEFEADTNANFSVILDISRSMDFGSGGITKFDYARYLAACLAWFSRKQRDRVGLVTFDDDMVDRVPPSAKNLNVVLHTLDRVKAGKPG